MTWAMILDSFFAFALPQVCFFLLACPAHHCAFKVSLWNFFALTVGVITCDSGSYGKLKLGVGGSKNAGKEQHLRGLA